MGKTPFIKRIFLFYLNGFKNMKLGKTLWIIILVKLFIIFFILKIFFFPNFLGKYKTSQDKEEHVSTELTQRITP